MSESQAIRLPYRVAVYVELTRPTYRAHHAGDSWLLVIRLPPRLLRCGCYMMFHLFVVSGSGQPAGFATGIALRGDTPIGSALKLAVVCAPTSRILIAPHRATRAMQFQLRAVRGAVPVATHHPTRRSAECHRYIFTPCVSLGACRASASDRLDGNGSLLLRAMRGPVCKYHDCFRGGYLTDGSMLGRPNTSLPPRYSAHRAGQACQSWVFPSC